MTFKTAREAYHDWRRRQHNDEEGSGAPVVWAGGFRKVYRHNGIVRDSRTFDPVRGVGAGFSEIQYAANRGSMYADADKAAIAHAINKARACPAPVLP